MRTARMRAARAEQQHATRSPSDCRKTGRKGKTEEYCRGFGKGRKKQCVHGQRERTIEIHGIEISSSHVFKKMISRKVTINIARYGGIIGSSYPANGQFEGVVNCSVFRI